MPANYGILYESVLAEATIRVVEPQLGPWLLTVKVAEFLTKKPVAGATVQVNGALHRTGPDGTVTLTVEGGTRTIIVSKSGYWTKTGTRLITEDTTIETSLAPIWMIVGGGAAVSAFLLFIGLALARKG